MKHKLYRVELLLLLLPLVFLALQQVFFRDATLDAHLHDTMYVIGLNYLIIAVLGMHLLFWLFHFLLRVRGWRTATICTGHVVITCVTLLFLLVPLLLAARDQAVLQAAAVWLVVHLAFFLYFLVTVIKNALFSK